MIGPLFADCAGDRELTEEFMTTLFDPPRAAAREALERAATAATRGEVDVETILDLIGTFVHYRALFGHAPTSDVEVEPPSRRRGIATDYPSLLKHSRWMGGAPKMHHLHSHAWIREEREEVGHRAEEEDDRRLGREPISRGGAGHSGGR